MPNFLIDRSELNRPQLEFLDDNETPFILLSAGFGTGKTTAEAAKALTLAAANPRLPGMVVAQSWTALESTLLYRMRQITGLALEVRGKERAFSFDGVTPIYARTAEAFKFADGLDVAWLVGDEARHWPWAAWDQVFRTRARLRCPCRQTALGSTPIGSWLAREWGRPRSDHRVIFGSTYENAHNLAPDYVSNLTAAWSPRMQRAALHGGFVVLEGAVFEAFDPDTTKSDWIVDYDAGRFASQPCEVWVDPGFRRSAVIWVRQHPTEPATWIAFEQQMPEGQPMTRVVEMINARAKAERRVIGDVIVDPAARQADQATAVTMRQVMYGINRIGQVLHPINFYRGIEWGVERVRALLGDPEIGMPRRLLFSRELAASEDDPRMGGRGVMRSLGGAKYKEAQDGHALSDKPQEDPLFEHALDACRYGVVLLWQRNPELRRLLVTPPGEGAGYAAL